MSFEIYPSPKVIVDSSRAGPDDFLELELESGHRLYIRTHPTEFDQFTFDEDLMPAAIIELSKVAAALKIARETNVSYKSIITDIADWFVERTDKHLNLHDYAAKQVRRDMIVTGWNITEQPGVQLHDKYLWKNKHRHIPIEDRWQANSKVTAIRIVNRHQAISRWRQQP